jgi:hypothetical protein
VRGAVAGRGQRHVSARLVEDARRLIGPLEGVHLGRPSPDPSDRSRNGLLPHHRFAGERVDSGTAARSLGVMGVLVGLPDRCLVRHSRYVHRNEHGHREDQDQEEDSG